MPSNLSQNKRPSRSATALVEVVSIISLVAMILSLSATVMHHAFRAHQHALAHFRQMEQLQRIVERWRADVRVAEQVDIDGGPDRPLHLVLHRAGEQFVRYQQSADNLMRVLESPQGTEQSETWPLPTGARFTCNVQSTGGQPLVIVRLEFPQGSHEPVIEWLACATSAQASRGVGEGADSATAGEPTGDPQ